ncbi:1,4-beta-xylanase [Lysinibacillus sphaericus]|uniref:polysaccharide deacetylase family protein n=1 Tax=Lysinibacillus sphaericus TaxID=1421 RepID=UPI0018CF7BAD|nr:polysaccharide deacetylase family protein [Lysinibacillus sphaericus]MBG9456980.1 1,4-beta-xylanase [Lysinibacillus sphaericus]MBG9480496.1 1,4-beta-xylanase [Lysinibacillus sphaericus]MBG9593024.1 1,4-beta-xylanase [Lysinibacillus sphaericus]
MPERRKKRGPMIDFLLIGLIISLTTIILVIILSKDDFKFQKISASKETETETDSITSNLSTESSAFPGIRIVTDVSNDKRTPFAIHYPETDNKAFNDAVLKYITDSKENYLSSMKKNKDKEAMGELNISLETFPYQKHYYSFVLTKTLYTGGANPDISTKTFFINHETGKLISIETLLNNDENNLSALATYVRKDLQQNPKLKEELFKDDVIKSTEPKWSNFHRFAIVDNSLQFYFDEYEITSGAAGPQTVKLPLSLINPLLASEFQIAMQKPTKPVNVGDPNQKRIALTFDDGPHPKVTEQILNTLDKYNAKATFFMLGSRVQYYPDIARDVLARGHEIGNHSWDHPVLTKLSLEQAVNQYTSTFAEIEKAINHKPTVFRPPYGATNDTINAQIPIPVVLWSIDTLDWKHRNAQQLLPNVKNNVHNNAIVLMHDIHQSTADGLDAVLAYLQGQGYEFVTVSEILPYRQK